MYPMLTPSQMIHLSLRAGMVRMEAQMVIALKMMGILGLRRVTPSGSDRMSSEKVSYLGQPAVAVPQAVMPGQPQDALAEVAPRPVARATKSNVKCTARRGPGKP